jgi:hypothetical protein
MIRGWRVKQKRWKVCELGIRVKGWCPRGGVSVDKGNELCFPTAVRTKHCWPVIAMERFGWQPRFPIRTRHRQSRYRGTRFSPGHGVGGRGHVKLGARDSSRRI